MRSSNPSLPTPLRTMTMSMGLLVFTFICAPCWAGAEADPGTNTATGDSTTPTEPKPPFIETTGHGLTTDTSTGGSLTSTSDALTGGSSPKTGASQSLKSTGTPTPDYLSWLYRLLNLEIE